MRLRAHQGGVADPLFGSPGKGGKFPIERRRVLTEVGDGGTRHVRADVVSEKTAKAGGHDVGLCGFEQPVDIVSVLCLNTVGASALASRQTLADLVGLGDEKRRRPGNIDLLRTIVGGFQGSEHERLIVDCGGL